MRNLSLVLFLIVASGCAATAKSPYSEPIQEPREAETATSKLPHPTHKNLNSLDLIWKARGLQAKEKIDKIEAQKKKSDSDLCTKDFEQTFYEHANPERSSGFKQDTPWGRVYILNFYHFSEFKNPETDGVKVSIIQFYYDKTGDLQKVEVSMLARDWRIQVSGKGRRGFMLDNSKCYYFIDAVDPFGSKVITSIKKS